MSRPGVPATRSDSRNSANTQREIRHTDASSHKERSRKSARVDSHIESLRHVVAVFGQRHGHSPSINRYDDLPAILYQTVPVISGSFEVDLEGYDLLATIFELCIHSWYDKITADTSFTKDTIELTAASLKSLKNRLLLVDIQSLLLDELPALILDHLQAVEYATRLSLSLDLQDSTRRIFSKLRPHPAFTQESRAADLDVEPDVALVWCQILVDKVLPLLLASEELANSTLRVLLNDIFARMILYNGVCVKSCESWFLWETFTRVIRIARQQPSQPQHSSLDADSQDHSLAPIAPAESLRQPALIYHLLQQVALLYYAMMHGWTIFMTWIGVLFDTFTKASVESPTTAQPMAQATPATKSRPSLVTIRLWPLLSYTIGLRQRMPWIPGLVSLLQWLMLHGSLRVYEAGSILDRTLSQYLDKQLSSSTIACTIVRSTRLAIFPNRSLAPSRPPPSQSEIEVIKQECIAAVLEAIPGTAQNIFFARANQTEIKSEIEGAVDMFADPVLNRALIISIVELAIARLFPELA